MDRYDEVARLLRDHIWELTEQWLESLPRRSAEERALGETELLDGIPDILRGVTKVVEDPTNLADFEPGGVIHKVASKLGSDRQTQQYEPQDILSDFSLLREKVWDFYRARIADPGTALDLEHRINAPLDKVAAVTIQTYFETHTAELKELARRDRLTAFLNYAAFQEELTAELLRARRYRRSVALLMLDIDEFKQYNDSYGHPSGDVLLWEVAKIIARSVRAVDIPARYGGDEFCIILPEAAKRPARRIAERLRRSVKVETANLARAGVIQAPVTISIGIASFPKDADSQDQLVSIADQALYDAKQAGRDMVAWT